MPVIQLPFLDLAEESPDYGDFLLLRKSGSTSDNRIKYYTLVSNIIPQLVYYYDLLENQDVFAMRRVESNGTTYIDDDKKITFLNLSRNINNKLKTSDIFTIESFTSNIIKLRTTNGLETTELKTNTAYYFTPTQDYTATSQIFIKVDNINTSYQLLYKDNTPIVTIKKDIEIRAIFNGNNFIVSSIADKFTSLNFLTESPDYNDLLLLRKSNSTSDNKIKYYTLVSNIIPQLVYYYDLLENQDVFAMRRVESNGTTYIDDDKKITFLNLSRNINNKLKTSDIFTIESFTSNIIKLRTTNGLETTELKTNTAYYFTPTQDYTATSQIFIKVDNINTSYQLLYKDNTPIVTIKKDIEIRAIFNGNNFIVSSIADKAPIAVNTKNDLPSAASNPGVIFYVSDQQKLVMSINNKWLIIATAGAEI